MVVPRPWFALGLFVLSLSASAQSPPSVAEYQVKAAFLLNFIAFTEWPATAFAARDAPLVVCVIGVDPFGETIDEIVEGETADQRQIAIRRIPGSLDVRGCHLAFIARSETKRLTTILEMTDGAPLLTVSDIDEFVRRGGTIGLFLDRNRVRFEIGLRDARRRNLKLSSQLLTLGRVMR